MSKIAIIFGSSTGATEEVAEKIKTYFDGSKVFDAHEVNPEELKIYDFLIFGASTTGVGDLQDDWDLLLPKVKKVDLKGKKAALFGLGDSASFSTSFAGGMSVIYNALKDNVTFVGAVSTDGYTFDDSESVVDGKFVGLALDEDNEYEDTGGRIAAWVEELKKHI